jgi:hypothetical protein
MVKVEMISKDVGARKNGAKTHVTQKYFLAPPRIKLWKKRLRIRRSCWVKGIELVTCPQTFQKTQRWVLNQNSGRKKSWGIFLICNISRVKGCVGAPGWD